MISDLAIAAAMLLLVAERAAPTRGAEDNCSVSSSNVEAAAVAHRLSVSDWNVFRKVARARLKRGLEALPGMIGCPSVAEAAEELKADPKTAVLLNRNRRSAEDYVRIAWAVLLANDPDFFGVKRNAIVAENVRFLAGRRREARALLDAN